MTQIDQFESTFRAAAKTSFTYQAQQFKKILLVTDLKSDDADAYLGKVQSFLGLATKDAVWESVSTEAEQTVQTLLDEVSASAPALICTYRHLGTEGWNWPYGLGEKLDVLIQVATAPVLILPHPHALRASDHALENTDVVMAMTDHLAEDSSLVNYACAFCAPGSTLILSHVEDESVFDRYMDAISKIPDIDTETARTEILNRLLKDPEDYIGSCQSVLAEKRPQLTIEKRVQTGKRLGQYLELIESAKVDLLLMHGKDADQLAMHGLAYPLAVEIRSIPLLLL